MLVGVLFVENTEGYAILMKARGHLEAGARRGGLGEEADRDDPRQRDGDVVSERPDLHVGDEVPVGVPRKLRAQLYQQNLHQSTCAPPSRPTSLRWDGWAPFECLDDALGFRALRLDPPAHARSGGACVAHPRSRSHIPRAAAPPRHASPPAHLVGLCHSGCNKRIAVAGRVFDDHIGRFLATRRPLLTESYPYYAALAVLPDDGHVPYRCHTLVDPILTPDNDALYDAQRTMAGRCALPPSRPSRCSTLRSTESPRQRALIDRSPGPPPPCSHFCGAGTSSPPPPRSSAVSLLHRRAAARRLLPTPPLSRG